MITATEYRANDLVTKSSFGAISRLMPKVSLVLWFLVSLSLFMILGPFSAPVALIAIFTLEKDERGYAEPEPLN